MKVRTICGTYGAARKIGTLRTGETLYEVEFENYNGIAVVEDGDTVGESPIIVLDYEDDEVQITVDNLNEVIKRISNATGYRVGDITLHEVSPDIICWSGENDENWDGYLNLRYFTPEELGVTVPRKITWEYFPYDLNGDAMKTHRHYATKIRNSGVLVAEGSLVWDLADPLPDGHVFTRRPYDPDERIA